MLWQVGISFWLFCSKLNILLDKKHLMFSVCKVAVDISHHLLTKVARVLHFLYCGFIFLATTEHKCPTTLFCNILLENYHISATKTKIAKLERCSSLGKFHGWNILPSTNHPPSTSISCHVPGGYLKTI